MIPSARIHRGFQRVGVVLAALALLLALFVVLQGERSVAFMLLAVAALLYAAARALA